MIGIALNLFVLLAAILFTIIYTRAFLASTGNWYSRLWTAFKSSATIAWAAFVIAGTKILDVIEVIANYLGNGAGDQIKASIDPKYAATVLVAIMIVTVLARLRSLWRGVTS